MTFFLVDMLTTMSQLVPSVYFMGKFIQVQRPVRFMIIYILITLVIYIATGYLVDAPVAVRTVFTFLSMFALLFYYRRIPLVPTAVYLLICLCCMFLVEIPSLLLALLINPNFSLIQDLSPIELFIWRSMCLPFIILSFAFPYWLCSKFFKFQNHKEISRYLPFIVVQIMTLIAPTCLVLKYTSEAFACTFSMIYLLSNIILDLLLVRSFNSLNRTHELELQKEQSVNLLRAQIDYYNHIQNNIQSVRQVRHDMKNQLQTVTILLEEKEYDTALQQLSAYREQLKATEASCFTGNTVLDAVISAKTDLCRQKDIPISCAGSIPNNVGVDPVHLCSIAANLLDNAIHACENLPPEISPSISFSANMKEGKLLFTCINPADPEKPLKHTAPEPTQEHGWGLSILSRIAQDYGGEMLLQKTDGAVCASLWLIPKNDN